ncbi:uncharacterized protein LOC111715442 [Eurytemora carolleeae]|uniref:uncharacterized protein LOC111715442 n=1 Tax=Eurytemora carolleeae TaxID=1294199 RepID=UPI000C7940BA|nr:uncharacterized protein LOC111715442 [Eurytemora carolleeae]|eukprot:XP_023346533.1 uncharacterized protein LOC111715442 [Eurytemora affinis]
MVRPLLFSILVSMVSSMPSNISPSVHLLLPDNLLDQFGCLFGCNEGEENNPFSTSSDPHNSIQVTGLNILQPGDPSFQHFTQHLCNQGGCGGQGYAAIPDPSSKPVLVLLGEDDMNGTEVFVLGDEEAQSTLGESGLMATLLNSLFNKDPNSVLSFEVPIPDSKDMKITEDIENIPIPEDSEEQPTSTELVNEQDLNTYSSRGAAAEEQIEIEEDDFPLESYNSSKDAQNELDSIYAKRPRTFHFKNSDDFRSPRTGKKNDHGRSSVQNFESRDIKFPGRDIKLPEREIKNFDVVYDVRELVKEERQGRRSNSGENLNFGLNTRGCAADMACVQYDECGPDGYVKGSRNQKNFHVGGRGMLQKCILYENGIEETGFCCRTYNF